MALQLKYAESLRGSRRVQVMLDLIPFCFGDKRMTVKPPPPYEHVKFILKRLPRLEVQFDKQSG